MRHSSGVLLATLLLTLPVAAFAQRRGGGSFGGGSFGGGRSFGGGGSFRSGGGASGFSRGPGFSRNPGLAPSPGFPRSRGGTSVPGFSRPGSSFRFGSDRFGDNRFKDGRFGGHGFKGDRFRNRRFRSSVVIFPFFGGGWWPGYSYVPFIPYSSYYDQYPYGYSSYYDQYPYGYSSPQVIYVLPDDTGGTSRPRQTMVDQLHRDLRVTSGKEGRLEVEWVGSDDAVNAIEFRTLDADEKVLDSQRSKRAPFRVDLRVPEKAAYVETRIEYPHGATVVLRLTEDEFRSLATK